MILFTYISIFCCKTQSIP